MNGFLNVGRALPQMVHTGEGSGRTAVHLAAVGTSPRGASPDGHPPHDHISEPAALGQRARRAERALEALVTLKDVTKHTDPEKYRRLKHGAWEEARAVLRERPPAEQ